MAKWVILIALALGIAMMPTRQSLEELVRTTLTLYFVIAGLLIIVMQRRAGEFLRPLLPLGLALLFLPPLFHSLTQYLGNTFLSLGSGWALPALAIGRWWLWPLLAALLVLILFRLIAWFRGRRPATGARPQFHRERERIMPQLDLGDEERE